MPKDEQVTLRDAEDVVDPNETVLVAGGSFLSRFSSYLDYNPSPSSEFIQDIFGQIEHTRGSSRKSTVAAKAARQQQKLSRKKNRK